MTPEFAHSLSDSIALCRRTLNHKISHYLIRQLDDFEDDIAERAHHFIGYPCNSGFHLNPLLDWWSHSLFSCVPCNEAGNPDEESSYALNMRPYEREVLEYFSNLYHFPKGGAWGYLTGGGTQGNEQGLYIGREKLKGHGKPILYVSKEAHYSIHSLAKILDIDTRIVACTENGEIDYSDLKQQLDRKRPALFSLAIGTTFKGAIDQIDRVVELVKMKKVPAAYFHADAALFGGFLPYLRDPQAPKIDFQKIPYDSIAVSGHKFYGSPVPVGVFLCRREHIQALSGDYIDYINAHNLTIPCSRSSLNTLIMWWTINSTSRMEFEEETAIILENAHYLLDSLRRISYPAWLNPFSNTVYFAATSDILRKRWSLATTKCPFLGPLAHAVVMQHVTKEVIDHFVDELHQSSIKIV